MPFCQNKFFGIFLYFMLLQQLVACCVEEQLGRLSSDEKACLEHFFATAIKQDHLGHVLFFSKKPACLLGEIISEKEASLFIKGWNVWKQKEPLFPHPNFIIYDEIVYLDNGNAALHIYFINKKTLHDSLSKLEGEAILNGKLLRDLEKKNTCSLFKEDADLIGFLLGFGIESSKQFKEHVEGLQLILCAQEGKITIENTANALLCRLNSEAKVHPVTFLGNPDSKEVTELKEIYAAELDKIEIIIQEKELLKLSLQALCEDG